jgi:hypothetical protein
VLERVESILGEPEELGPADLQVVRLDHRLVHTFGEELDADRFPEGGVVRPDEAAFAGDRLDDALVFELGWTAAVRRAG